MAEGDKEGKKTTSLYYWNKIMQLFGFVFSPTFLSETKVIWNINVDAKVVEEKILIETGKQTKSIWF